jgi:serine/threonine protein phosphatase PrpC
MKYAIVQDSRVGARHVNQDRIGTWRTPAALLMVVADGLGGHLRGEVAAQLAIALAGAAFTREAQPKLADPEAFLGRVFGAAHAAILREAQKLELADTPRTVIVACVVQDGYAYWTHVGDSRLYVLRQGQVLHRTRDHTLVQQLVDQGRVREEAMTTHPERNRLLQCLGGYQTPRPEPASRARLARNDVVLLCSDGFWGPLTQRQIIHELLSRQLKEAISELASLAERRAGPDCDNVSVLAMTWGEDEVVADEGPRTIPRYDLPKNAR